MFYNKWQLKIKAIQNDIFDLASSADDVITTYNSASDLTNTLTFDKGTVLAKFRASCGNSCSQPLDTIKIYQISSGTLGSELSNVGTFL